jgi:hypothetical protein
MPRSHRAPFLLLLLGMTAAFTGCATAPSVDGMTPQLAPETLTRTGKTVSLTVSGGQKTRGWDKPKIGDLEFGEALRRALVESGMFSEVRTEGPADLELSAEIVSQQTSGTFTNDEALFVNYRVVERASGRELYRENVVSQLTMGAGETFNGQARMRKLKEGAVRENLRILVPKLSEALAKG